MTSSRHRFLVTGAAGFVGANISRRLVERAEEVHVLVKPTTSLWRLEDLLDRLELHTGDITDASYVDKMVDEVKPTVIYHLATHGAYHYQDEAEQILRTNVMGLWHLLRACSRVGYHLLVNTGSSSEYGATQHAMRETDMLDPNSFYAVSKAAQSLLCRHVGRTGRGPVVTLRLFSVYGPYEEPTRLIPQLMMSALEDRGIDMVSPQTVRDFVYVDDVVNVYLEVEKLGAVSGAILNVGTGVQTSLGTIVEKMGRVNGSAIRARWNSMQARPWDSSIWVSDVTNLRRNIGWVPETTVEQGLARTLEWFRRHRDHYRTGMEK